MDSPIRPRKAVWRFHKKLKIELPYDPVIPLLGMYPKELKSGYNRDILAYYCLSYHCTHYPSYGNYNCFMDQEICDIYMCIYILLYAHYTY
jgi:hypothetical protein